MITDKDSEELRELTRQIRSTKMDVVFFDYGWNECAEIIMRYVNKKCTESADQARKEAAERVARAWREHGEGITLRIIRAAILGDSVVKENLITDHIPDTGEKLAIAVKALRWALEYIGDGFLPEEGTPDHDCGYIIEPDNGACDFCENYWKARDALKEIQ